MTSNTSHFVSLYTLTQCMPFYKKIKIALLKLTDYAMTTTFIVIIIIIMNRKVQLYNLKYYTILNLVPNI